MAYASWSVVFGEQPSATKWNILGTNDASFNDFVTGTNGVHAAWASWSPSYSAITIGNGTVVAKYIKYGTTVFFRWSFVLGSTSAIGTTPTLTLPVTAKSDYIADSVNGEYIGNAFFLDTSTAGYDGKLKIQSTTIVQFALIGAGGTYAAYGGVTATAPFTFGTGDKMNAYGTYEAAS